MATLARLPQKPDMRRALQTSKELRAGQLHKFLASFKVQKGEPYNFTNMASPFGCYMVPDDQRHAFYQAFANSIEANVLPRLTEKPGTASPVVVDVDLKHEPGTFTGRAYTEEDIKAVIAAHMSSIGEYVELTEDNGQIYVFERPEPYLTEKGDVVKDGFHLMLPKIRCCAPLKHHARARALEACESMIQALGVTNPVEDVFDKAVIEKNNWFVYGGAKEGLPPYILTHVYDLQLQEIPGGIDIPLIDLLPLLANSGEVENVTYVKELPPVKPEADRKLTRGAAASRSSAALAGGMQAHPSDVAYAKTLVPLLSITRADDENNWMEVGWCLHNISVELLPAWIVFSKTSGKFEEGKCEEKWAAMVLGTLGMGSLVRWAKEDSPDLFESLQDKLPTTLDEYIEEAMAQGGQHVNCARVFRQMFPDKFKWVATKGATLVYVFEGHTWVQLDDDAQVYSLFFGEVSEAFRQKAASYSTEIAATSDLAKKEALEKKKTMAGKIATKLGDVSYVSKALIAASKLSWSKGFLEQLDTNLDLLAFKNGAYELLTGRFRPGQPCDMLSVSTSYDYPASDPARRAALMAFLRQLLPKEDVLEYLLDQFSQCLSGRVRKQLFHIFSGPLAGNGKSTLFKLLALAFGQYYCSIPIAYLTQKNAQANAPNPIILAMKPARLVTCQEPEEGSRFNSSITKELVGGDEQQGRTLFSSKLVNYHPQFKLFAACNDAPEIQGKDEGLKRRIRMVGFNSQFKEGVTEADLENHVYPINVDMGDLLKEWAPELMCLLIERYSPDYQYTCPPSILELSASYMDENDAVQQFVSNNLQRDPKQAITFAELRGMWSGSGVTMKLAELKNNFVRVLGTACIKDSSFEGVNMKNFFKGWKANEIMIQD